MAQPKFPDIPYETPIVEGDTRPIAQPWYLWLFEVIKRIVATPQILKVASLTSQAAAISATAIAIGGAGLYRVTWVVRVTQAATSSSGVTITIGNSDDGVPLTQSGAALTGNVVGAIQSGSALVRSDAAAPVTYAAAYASIGAQVMRFKLDVTCERLS